MAPERSRPERSSPDSFLPVKSAGWRDVAEAMAASTSARVISAEAISGDARSTCCIMPCPAAGTPDASANSPIAPIIQVDGCMIVSLYLADCRPSGRAPMANGQTYYHLSGRQVWPTAAAKASGPLRSNDAALAPLDRSMMTPFLPRCMLGL